MHRKRLVCANCVVVGLALTGMHTVNKQLNDKERVAAALENDSLVSVVNQCIAKTDKLQTKQQ